MPRRLTVEQVRAIRAEYATGKVLQKDLARKYGVTRVNISYILRRRTWRNVK